MPATPLTVLSPVPLWWSWWVRLTWVVARLTPSVAAPLRALSFIHFARWALIGRWPPDRGGGRDRAAPRALLFLTTFDGSGIQYVEAFVRVVPGRIAGLYAGAKGFPGPRRFGPVARYIEDHSYEPEHFWMAYPDATTTMVARALELQRLHRERAPRSARDIRRFLTSVQGLL